MAITGIKHPVAAKIDTESYSAVAYGQGVVIGAVLKADITIEGQSDNDLYGDNGILETDDSFSGGTVALNVDELSDENYCYLLGAKTETVLGKTVIRDSGADVSPYVGFGYYKTGKKNNVPYYVAYWYYKLKFAKPSESAETIKKQITWQTPTIEAPILSLGNGDWRDFARFDSEQAAIAWLDALAELADAVDKSDLATAIAAAGALEAETYTSTSWANLAIALVEAEKVNAEVYASQAMVNAAEAALTAAQTDLVQRT